MRSRRHALAGGLALAYSLALLGDQMLYVFLPSNPAAAGIAAEALPGACFFVSYVASAGAREQIEARLQRAGYRPGRHDLLAA